jgi:hypothetical protein
MTTDFITWMKWTNFLNDINYKNSPTINIYSKYAYQYTAINIPIKEIKSIMSFKKEKHRSFLT